MPSQKPATSYRFQQETQDLIAAIAEDTALSRTAVIEMAVRDLAKKRKIELRDINKNAA